MKKRIAGWILFVWGLLGLLVNLIFWMPYLTDTSDIGFFLINSFSCLVFIWIGILLIKKGKRKTIEGLENG